MPAGNGVEDVCRFCGEDLADENGYVMGRGMTPLVGGSPPESFNALMDALRDAGAEVTVLEMTAVRVGDALLISVLAEDGELIGAEVCEGQRVAEVADAMDLMQSDE
jgi:hypothetical protein